MQEGRILKTEHAEFQVSAWNGKNESGFKPIHDRVMVLPDSVNDRTIGGVLLPQDVQERQAMAAISGTIIDLGPEAFKRTPEGREWTGARPSVGSHVYFERYAGQVFPGHDGRVYRLMDASCIGAVATSEVA